ncbi:DUF1906 domain-containing protein [Paenibacillus oryzisoli]|uniref:Rv2525c-like glycoside hydrolase-like domain-containing protein n=1 Tax=Paenibacillus oryzisoli TaxID=1850517 RepID=A0A198AJ76_9BACL|nr:DUF1906 domain-containing protein [Paenibacillus oryzisoli]OAS21125.1 hypothetical protein A8708_30000 [Paenibacillus oryzisoli]
MKMGFDCATPLTADLAKRFKTGGYDFVGRYLVPGGWKALTAAEVKTIGDAGLGIISVFETTADRALGGYEAGKRDGAIAVQVAAQVGQPDGSCIYFAVDFDATSAQMATVIDYIRGASEATPNHTTGVYGSYDVIVAVRNAAVCSRFWQTYAWSGGRRADLLDIYQYKNDVQVNGIGIDFNSVFTDAGAWTLVKEEEEHMMKVEDANKVIAFLSAAYAATDSEEARAEFHRLANELRKVSGQTL